MNLTEFPMKREERVLFALRTLYQKYGYRQFKMGKFEEYDLYARNKDFLVSEGVITFTDTDGRLMALKPDVTLSIIKNTKDLPGSAQKVCYSENVYRVSGSTRSFKEIMQTGLECIGNVDLYTLCEVILLAAESLRIIDANYVLDLSHMGVIAALIDDLKLDEDVRRAVVRCIGDKNADGVRKLCPGADIRGVLALIAAHGKPAEVIEALRPWCASGEAKAALNELESVSRILSSQGCEGVRLDFSIVNDMNYYNGIVFRGYINGIPTGVLAGGQYDNLMARMGRSARAVGFAAGPYDIDTVLLYDPGADVTALTRCVKMLTDSGCGVLAQQVVPERLRYRQLLRFKEGGFEILESHG